MLDAPVIVSIEGSHLSHVAYTLRDEGTLVVLQPADRFALNYKELTDCLGAGFGFLVCDASAGGFTAPLDQLRRMLDQLWSERPADGQRR
jgi:hypothetical protein